MDDRPRLLTPNDLAQVWEACSKPKQRKIAFKLLIGLTAPPRAPSSLATMKLHDRRKSDHTEKEKKRKLREAQAALRARGIIRQMRRRLLSPQLGPDLADPATAQYLHRQLKQLALLKDASPVSTYKKDFQAVWPELQHCFLIALALIRQRADFKSGKTGSDSGHQRAIYLVQEAFPVGSTFDARRSHLETLTYKYRTVWAFGCALVYFWAREQGAEISASDKSLHEFLPEKTPTFDEVRQLFLMNASAIISIAQYFEVELASASSLKWQKQPLQRGDCIRLPRITNLTAFETPIAFTYLTESERGIAKSYSSKNYRAKKGVSRTSLKRANGSPEDQLGVSRSKWRAR